VTVAQRTEKRWAEIAPFLPRTRWTELKEKHAQYYHRLWLAGFNPRRIKAYGLDDPRLCGPDQLLLMQQFADPPIRLVAKK